MRLIDARHMIDKGEILLADKTKLHEAPYAILSHTWGRQECFSSPDGTRVRGEWGHDDDEILFADIGEDDTKQQKPDAWEKILKACEVARDHECDYLWVDTCCFNKESSAELDESINAMFAWYQQSEVCLVYLADFEFESVQGQGEEQLKDCRWFGRGWTLQELIAPVKVEFYNQDWEKVGTRSGLVDVLSRITRIAREALTGEKSYSSFTVAERMKWAASRETKRPEDTAYSLLGLFDVHMTLIYGIGAEKAFQRLQTKLIQFTTDMTVFAWNPKKNPDGSTRESSPFCSMLADSPNQFKESPEMKSMELEGHFSITNKGVSLDASTLRLVPKDTPAFTLDASTSKIIPKDKPEFGPALVLLLGHIDNADHTICYGFYLQKIGNANYVRYANYKLAEFIEPKNSYQLKPVPRHQCYITISPQDVAPTLKKSHSKSITVPKEFLSQVSNPKWHIERLDLVPERIWDYENDLFFRVSYGHRDVVRAVSMVLTLLDQQVRFAVLFHRYGGKDKVVILDDKNDKWSTIKPIFGPSQRFDSVKWDDLMIDLAVQSEYLDVVAQGRSYRVSASLEDIEGKLQKTRLKLDVAPDSHQQIERLEQRLRELEKRLEGMNEKRDRDIDDAGVDEGASKKHKSVA